MSICQSQVPLLAQSWLPLSRPVHARDGQTQIPFAVALEIYSNQRFGMNVYQISDVVCDVDGVLKVSALDGPTCQFITYISTLYICISNPGANVFGVYRV